MGAKLPTTNEGCVPGASICWLDGWTPPYMDFFFLGPWRADVPFCTVSPANPLNRRLTRVLVPGYLQWYHFESQPPLMPDYYPPNTLTIDWRMANYKTLLTVTFFTEFTRWTIDYEASNYCQWSFTVYECVRETPLWGSGSAFVCSPYGHEKGNPAGLLWQSLNIPASDSTFLEVLPTVSGGPSLRLADKRTASCVHIITKAT